MPYTEDELDELLKKDEETIRSEIEYVRKHPVKIKPKLEHFLDGDLFACTPCPTTVTIRIGTASR
ncbi:MAG: hypothetical protein J6U20_01535 [Fibrobacter sp.]|nr:hypothetical protein [Fibrobacter sp.]